MQKKKKKKMKKDAIEHNMRINVYDAIINVSVLFLACNQMSKIMHIYLMNINLITMVKKEA